MICPNPVWDVLSAIHHDGDVRLALRRFHGEPVRALTFVHEFRPVARVDVEHIAATIGFEVTRHIGLRVAVDRLPEGPAKTDPDNYPAILEIELALAEQQAYVDVRRAWQILLFWRRWPRVRLVGSGG